MRESFGSVTQNSAEAPAILIACFDGVAGRGLDGRRHVCFNPFEKRGPIGCHIVTAVVLAPREVAADEFTDRRHLVG